MNLVQTPDQFNFILQFFRAPRSEYITEDEFNAIPICGTSHCNTKSDEMFKIARNCKTKNRYSNILPYNDNRVILNKPNEPEPCNTYINASPMPSGLFGRGNNVIITQGPIEATIPDFINMLYHNNVTNIIMVTNLVESGNSKCADYTGNLADKMRANYTITPYKISPDRFINIESDA